MDPNLIPLVAIVMGISVVLVPVMGMTARYVLKPFQDALIKAVQSHGNEETVRVLERRLALMEQQLESMESTLNRVSDAVDFHRELQSPQPPSIAASSADPRP